VAGVCFVRDGGWPSLCEVGYAPIRVRACDAGRLWPRVEAVNGCHHVGHPEGGF
jgi:hypothetical protein